MKPIVNLQVLLEVKYFVKVYAGYILYMHSANERQRYIVMRDNITL